MARPLMRESRLLTSLLVLVFRVSLLWHPQVDGRDLVPLMSAEIGYVEHNPFPSPLVVVGPPPLL
jgi:hypothetical protein